MVCWGECCSPPKPRRLRTCLARASPHPSDAPSRLVVPRAHRGWCVRIARQWPIGCHGSHVRGGIGDGCRRRQTRVRVGAHEHRAEPGSCVPRLQQAWHRVVHHGKRVDRALTGGDRDVRGRARIAIRRGDVQLAHLVVVGPRFPVVLPTRSLLDVVRGPAGIPQSPVGTEPPFLRGRNNPGRMATTGVRPAGPGTVGRRSRHACRVCEISVRGRPLGPICTRTRSHPCDRSAGSRGIR